MPAMHQNARAGRLCGLGIRSLGEVLSQAEIARRVGRTENAIKKAPFRLRQRNGQLVRTEIAQAQISQSNK
jgi:hypothetical protein